MRTLLVTSALLAQLVVSKVLPIEPPLNFTSPDFFELSATARRNLVARQNTPPPGDDPEWEDPYDKMWKDALCRGERLLHAMTLKELDAALKLGWPYLQSPWDGDLKDELQKWDMGIMFKGLNINGSPNGLGAAYFLLQHHRQLGGAKSINKVNVVTCEDDGGDPCLIFYVGTVLTDSKKRHCWFW
ncbi:hypothetical protein E8E11_006493 [Didymella keratinophila]|nr:hypothetical protein E8E11_006493 [Didymella keratinophila]